MGLWDCGGGKSQGKVVDPERPATLGIDAPDDDRSLFDFCLLKRCHPRHERFGRPIFHQLVDLLFSSNSVSQKAVDKFFVNNLPPLTA